MGLLMNIITLVSLRFSALMGKRVFHVFYDGICLALRE